MADHNWPDEEGGPAAQEGLRSDVGSSGGKVTGSPEEEDRVEHGGDSVDRPVNRQPESAPSETEAARVDP
ncbi:MAG: hypothetical protein H0V12_06365 [Chloroflexi bacterium]|jgi:hypothetical protein|nr:hypothetical protein [Chloroflexota bacterium]